MQQKLFDGGKIDSSLSDETKKSLHEQLIKLGDMMGDGLHYESDGKWIQKEYQKVLYALYPDIKKRKAEASTTRNNQRAKKVIMENKCTCGGILHQTRNGSLTLGCMVCENRFKIKKAKK